MESYQKKAGNFVRNRIFQMSQSKNESAVRAMLANLRRGLGKHPAEIPAAWEASFYNLPEELHGKGAEPSRGEYAVHIAMTLFALHQQRSDLHTEFMQREEVSIGKAMGQLHLCKSADSDAVKKRFDQVVSADSLAELSYHLRGVVQILRAEEIAMDYGMLAENLCNFQLPAKRDAIRLQWGRDYYTTISSANKKDEQKG